MSGEYSEKEIIKASTGLLDNNPKLNIKISKILDETILKTSSLLEQKLNFLNILNEILSSEFDDGFNAEKIINRFNVENDNIKLIEKFIVNNLKFGFIYKITNNNHHNISKYLPHLIGYSMKNIDKDDCLNLFIFILNNGYIKICIGDNSGEIGKINNQYFLETLKFEKMNRVELDIDDILNYKILKKDEN